MLRTCVFAAILAFVAGAAQAQSAPDHPRVCVMSVGPTQMMFSAFQDRNDDVFCQRVPEAGPTTIILDARDGELRDMNVEVRVLRNAGQKDWRDGLDANTVALVPAKKHLANGGTATFRVNLDKDGDYITVVRAFSDDGVREYVGEYDFSVGGFTEWHAMVAVLAVVVVGLSFALLRRPRHPAPEGAGEKPAATSARQTT